MPKFNSGSVNSLRALPDRISQVFTEYSQRRSAAISTPRVRYGASPDEVAKSKASLQLELDQMKNGAIATLEDLRTNAAEFHTSARRDIQTALGRPATSDVNEALLREMREQRAWARVKGTLDRQGEEIPTTVKKLAQEALVAQDDDLLEAIRVELPAYLSNRGHDHLIQLATGEFESVLAAARPVVKDALSARSEVETGIYQLEMRINGFKDAIENGYSSVVVPTWNKGETQTIQGAPATAAA